MIEFILVIFVYAGPMSNGDSVALTNVPGFKDRASCEGQGRASAALTTGTVKAHRFVCLEQRR